MNTPRYCFTGRGAALFRYLDLQSHINTHMKYHARRRPQSVQCAIVTKGQGRMWTSWVLPKKAVHMQCMLDPPRHLGNPMSVVPPLAVQEVPGETDSSFAACSSVIGEGQCCYAPVLADLFTIPLSWAGPPRPIREERPGYRGACKRRALDFNS